MKNIGVFLSENFQFLEMKFSIYLNRRFRNVTVKYCQLVASAFTVNLTGACRTFAGIG